MKNLLLRIKLNYMYSAAQIYSNYAYAYYTLVFCVYAYVYMRIRVYEYTRICPFVMHSHKFLCMKHCWSNKGHRGMKRLRSEICILLKRHADQWKLSHFKFSITSQIQRPFLWLLLDLKLQNMGRRLKQSLEIPILTCELYVFTRKDLCFGTGRKSFAKYFLSEFSVLKIIPGRKNYISGYIWHRSFIQTVKWSFLDEKFVYQSFYDAPFMFSYFLLQGKVLFCTRQQVACEMFICRKCSECLAEKILSLVVFDLNCSFKTVKCSFFNQITVYQSFYGAPLTFLCFGRRRQVVCEMFV